jgi:hypothetical protein
MTRTRHCAFCRRHGALFCDSSRGITGFWPPYRSIGVARIVGGQFCDSAVAHLSQVPSVLHCFFEDLVAVVLPRSVARLSFGWLAAVFV